MNYLDPDWVDQMLKLASEAEYREETIALNTLWTSNKTGRRCRVVFSRVDLVQVQFTENKKPVTMSKAHLLSHYSQVL